MYQNSVPISNSQRPSLVTGCAKMKFLHLVALTIPHLDNINVAQVQKEEWYEEPMEESEDSEWQAKYVPVEIVAVDDTKVLWIHCNQAEEIN